MGLFGRKQAEPQQLLLTDDLEIASYDSALNYLVGLSASEHGKMLKIVATHRRAKKEEAKLLGIKEKPSSKLLTIPYDELDFIFPDDQPYPKPIKPKGDS